MGPPQSCRLLGTLAQARAIPGIYRLRPSALRLTRSVSVWEETNYTLRHENVPVVNALPTGPIALGVSGARYLPGDAFVGCT